MYKCTGVVKLVVSISTNTLLVSISTNTLVIGISTIL